MKPNFDLDKIKYSVDEANFRRAVDLYQNDKVKKFNDDVYSFTALVEGTKPYSVRIDQRFFDRGECNCYLGQRDVLCKHMVAVALYAVLKGKPIEEKEKSIITMPESSNRLGELSKQEVSEVKKEISYAIRFIKAYRGPSKYWFQYQDSLTEGCRRVSKIINELPVGISSSKLLVSLLLRLDKKLSTGGVDDSDGTVGDFMMQVVDVLLDYYSLCPDSKKTFKKLCGIESCFGFEEPLVRVFDEG